MTISEHPIPTTLRPLVDGLGPRHHALVVHLRSSFDKNKTHGRYTGFRELQKWSYATTVRMSSAVICRVLSGLRFPDYRETCHLWELFTSKVPTGKLERLWCQAASERGIDKKDIYGQTRKAVETPRPPYRGRSDRTPAGERKSRHSPRGGTVASTCGCG